jgi:hypothetical protein
MKKEALSDFSGWYETEYYRLWVEDGIIKRGTTKENSPRPVHPYKRDQRGGWNQSDVKLSTYLRSDAWEMM